MWYTCHRTFKSEEWSEYIQEEVELQKNFRASWLLKKKRLGFDGQQQTPFVAVVCEKERRLMMMIDHSTRSVEIPKYIIVRPDAIERFTQFFTNMDFSRACVITQQPILSIVPEIASTIPPDSDRHVFLFASDRPELNQLISMVKEVHTIKPEVLIGVGGGSVLDSVKFISHIVNIPMVLIPTLASNDGICSPVVSIKLEKGRSDSLRARMPFALFADTQLLSKAPQKYLFSGLGDVISNITAIMDWELSSQKTGEKIDYFARILSEMSYKSILNFSEPSMQNLNFIETLTDSLITSGISMEYAGSSRSASGSEHMLSHAADIVFKSAHLHGHQVGFYTCVILKAYQTPLYQRVMDFFHTVGFFHHIPNALLLSDPFRAITGMARVIRKRYGIMSQLSDPELKDVFESTVSDIRQRM